VRGPQLNSFGQWIAAGTWLVFLVASLALFVPSLTLWDVFYSQPERTLQSFQDAQLEQNYQNFLVALDDYGITPQFYGHFFSFLRVAAAFPYYLLSFLIVLRGRRYLMSVLFALLLLVFGAAGPLANPLWGSLENGFPALFRIALVFNAFISGAMVLLYVFPDGAFTPGWTRFAAPVVVLLVAGSNLLPGSPLDYWSWAQPLPVVINLAMVASGGVALWQRYQRYSNPIQRQQIKWFLAGVLLILINWLGDFFTVTIYPALTGEWLFPEVHDDLIREIGQETAWYISSFLLALCIGLSVFRYRLWDIDLILRRTLIYGLLSGVLVSVYLALVLVSQSVFISLTGQRSPVSLVISTLAIAGLFHPLRLRIQTAIDRRFFRRKYDAERILEAFGARLMGKVDLDELGAFFQAAVKQALQPEQISLWINKSVADSPVRLVKQDGPDLNSR
jgi:hypothetical protein